MHVRISSLWPKYDVYKCNCVLITGAISLVLSSKLVSTTRKRKLKVLAFPLKRPLIALKPGQWPAVWFGAVSQARERTNRCFLRTNLWIPDRSEIFKRTYKQRQTITDTHEMLSRSISKLVNSAEVYGDQRIQCIFMASRSICLAESEDSQPNLKFTFYFRDLSNNRFTFKHGNQFTNLSKLNEL